jgi:hypothetical protein
MLIIVCDFHPGFQQVAIFDNLTGEIEGKRAPRYADFGLGTVVWGRSPSTVLRPKLISPLFLATHHCLASSGSLIPPKLEDNAWKSPQRRPAPEHQKVNMWANRTRAEEEL